MDESEKKAIYHYRYELKNKTIASPKVLRSLHKDEVIDDKEKMDLLKTRSSFDKMSSIIEAVKKKQWGFSALCKALLEEVRSNKFIVDKLETKVKTIKKEQTKHMNKPDKNTEQPQQISQRYKELHEIAHGSERETKVDPSQGEIDDLVDYFWSCREELTDKQPDDKSLLCLIKERKEENKLLEVSHRVYKNKISALNDSLSNSERLRKRAEREMDDLRKSMKEQIKMEVNHEVKMRLMSLEGHVPYTPSTGSDDDSVTNKSDTTEMLYDDDHEDENDENPGSEVPSNGNININVNSAAQLFIIST